MKNKIGRFFWTTLYVNDTEADVHDVLQNRCFKKCHKKFGEILKNTFKNTSGRLLLIICS